MKIRKKLLSMLLTAALVLSLLPAVMLPALAATSYDVSSGSVNITAAGDYIITSGGFTGNTITVSSSITGAVNITLSGVTISSASSTAFSIGTGTTVNLTLSGTNTLTGGTGCAGLQVSNGAVLNITADSSDGKLYAYGGAGSAGSDGGAGGDGGAGINGTMEITGGTVNTTGGAGGAGGYSGMYGGNGGDGGAGINGTMEITGGTVYATGGNGGDGGNGNDPGYPGDGGAGINGAIEITGGTVNATGGNGRYGGHSGAGIAGSSCVIDGGSVKASINTQPKNSNGDSVYLSTVTLNGISAVTDVSYTVDDWTTSISCATDSSGKLYLWLPVSSSTTIGAAITGTYTTHYVAANCAITATAASNVFTALEEVYITASKADAAYDGNSHAGYSVTAVKDASGADITSSVTSSLAAVYYSGDTASGTALSGAPSETGTYTVVLTVSSSSGYYADASVTFNINKATTIATLPTASSIPSGSALSNSTLSGGAAAGVDGNAIEGTFSWADGNKVITADGDYDVVFTPDDNAYYATVSGTVRVLLYPTLSDTGVGSISDSEASLNFTSDEAGTYYYLVYKAYATAPSAATVKAQGNSEAKGTGSGSASVNTVSVTGLSASTSYVAYVIVIDSDGNSSTVYSIEFTTAQKDATLPTLSSLTLSGASLSPTFASGTTAYTATVFNTTTSIDVTAASNVSGSTVTVNGGASPATVSLNVGSNTITVVVMGIDGVTKNTYTITVTREAAISISTTSLPVGIVGASYSKTLAATGGSGSYTWSAEALPAVLNLDEDTGAITGTPTLADTGTYSVKITVSDGSATATATFTLTIREGCGNGAYLIASDGDDAYTGSYTDDGIPTLTVNTGYTGFTYFSVDVSAVTGHTGTETCVFVQIRGGVQIAFCFLNADFDTVDKAGAGFNVKPGDIIEVYLVDNLSNSGTPTIL